jgi:hypothetical protein
MAFEYVDTQSKISLAAGADLSSSQYFIVKLSGAGVVLCDDVTDVPIGVLQNDPESGETASVAVDGITKVVADEAISVGALIGVTAAGKAVDLTAGTDTTAYIIGQAITAATADGDVITITLDCKSPARAA